MDDLLLAPFDPARCRAVRGALNRWYVRHARPLPWRESADPYRIWISEVMLQQTTVKAVIPYYERFLARFPTVVHLAGAAEAEVLQLWEGLGYYSRGRNLRIAAQQICEKHAGVFPCELEQLQSLPGIGRYTAGAIRSFGFDLPAPIVEANTVRLYCRLLGFGGDPKSPAGQALLWKFAERIQPRTRAGHLNQALMEHGATICTPTRPRCGECPVARWCIGFQQGNPQALPVQAPRAKPTQVVEITIALRCGERWLVRQREPQERWSGMWDFPRYSIDFTEFDAPLTPKLHQQLRRHAQTILQDQLGVQADELQETLQLRHSVTRYRIRLVCLQGTTRTMELHPPVPQQTRWASLPELEQLPMPVTGRKFVRHLEGGGGKSSPQRRGGTAKGLNRELGE